VYVRELQIRYRLRRVAGTTLSPARILTPWEGAQFLLPLLQHEAVEVCGLVCLSSCYDVLAYHELSRGALDATLVHPREVFRTALLTNARHVLVGHNHPSGDPTPSAADLDVTRRLVRAGEILGLDLVDHLIIAAPNRYVSLKETQTLDL
jgi:DNA repair protein RadC